MASKPSNIRLIRTEKLDSKNNVYPSITDNFLRIIFKDHKIETSFVCPFLHSLRV